MSTRSVIARFDREAGFRGRFHRRDGYPSGVGRQLWLLYHGVFAGDLDRMQRVLLDEHPAGWYSIIRDWSEPVGYRNDGRGEGPQCFCHGDLRSEGREFSAGTAIHANCEYAYVLHDRPYHRLEVLVRVDVEKGSYWQLLTQVAFTDPEPDWVDLNLRGE